VHKTSRREFQAASQSGDYLFFNRLTGITTPGVRVYQIHLDHPAGLDTSTLNEAELARGRKMRGAGPQRRALAGRVALREILAIETSCSPAMLSITTQPGGKPVLAGKHLHFSLAHTGAFAAMAVSDQCPVGIDLECIQRQSDFEELATRFFHPGEAAWLKDDCRLSFFRLWTSKEAVLKCTGEGIAHRLAELRTRKLTPLNAHLEYSRAAWEVEFLNIIPDLIAAVTIQSRDVSVLLP